MLFYLLASKVSANWEEYLAPIHKVSSGCCILSADGVLCGELGGWHYNVREAQIICSFFKNGGNPKLTFLLYNRKKFLIIKKNEKVVYANAGKSYVIVYRVNSFFICCHLVEGQSARVAINQIVRVANVLEKILG